MLVVPVSNRPTVPETSWNNYLQILSSLSLYLLSSSFYNSDILCMRIYKSRGVNIFTDAGLPTEPLGRNCFLICGQLWQCEYTLVTWNYAIHFRNPMGPRGRNVKRSYFQTSHLTHLHSTIGFEVFQDDLSNHQPGSWALTRLTVSPFWCYRRLWMVEAKHWKNWHEKRDTDTWRTYDILTPITWLVENNVIKEARCWPRSKPVPKRNNTNNGSAGAEQRMEKCNSDLRKKYTRQSLCHSVSILYTGSTESQHGTPNITNWALKWKIMFETYSQYISWVSAV